MRFWPQRGLRLAIVVAAWPGLVAVAAVLADPASFQERPPNLILILADDAGFADFGFQDAPAPDLGLLTPNIDTLARDGARFRSFYVSACVCSPSRAGLLTGRYQQRFGHETNLPPGYAKGGLPLGERTLADRLKQAGYVTGCIGKWHLGYPPRYHPCERGFDVFFGCLQGSRSYYPDENPTPYRVLLENRRPTPEEGYVTDRLGDAAVRFVRASKDEPFFLFLSFTAPHGPLQPRKTDLAHPVIGKIPDERRRKYAGLVKAMDDNVGKLLAVLDEEGLADKTLVLFTNDNGGQTKTGARNAPFRGRKGTLWEGGVRVPCAVRWPGHIAPGQVVDDPVSALDLLPTFLAAAGRPLGDDAGLDGLDVLPRLTGRAVAVPERPLFWRSLGKKGPIALRHGKWKLVREDRDKPPLLFDLQTDLFERHDLYLQYPYVARDLLNELARWENELIDPLWGVKPGGD